MVYDMQGTAISVWLAIQIRIGPTVFLTGRAPLDVASAWNQL
jgi:hypothetical protein